MKCRAPRAARRPPPPRIGRLPAASPCRRQAAGQPIQFQENRTGRSQAGKKMKNRRRIGRALPRSWLAGWRAAAGRPALRSGGAGLTDGWRGRPAALTHVNVGGRERCRAPDERFGRPPAHWEKKRDSVWEGRQRMGDPREGPRAPPPLLNLCAIYSVRVFPHSYGLRHSVQMLV